MREKQVFLFLPFLNQAVNPFPVLLCVWTWRRFFVRRAMCISCPSSLSRSPAGTLRRESQPLSPSMLCYSQARLFITSSWLAVEFVPDSQWLLYWQTQTLPHHSHTHTQAHTHTYKHTGTAEADGDTEPEWEGGGGADKGRVPFFLSTLLDTCYCDSGSPAANRRWGSDKTLSDRETPQPAPRMATPLEQSCQLSHWLCSPLKCACNNRHHVAHHVVQDNSWVGAGGHCAWCV